MPTAARRNFERFASAADASSACSSGAASYVGEDISAESRGGFTGEPEVPDVLCFARFVGWTMEYSDVDSTCVV